MSLKASSIVLLATALTLLAGCSGKRPPEAESQATTTAAAKSFVNRVWRVAGSSSVQLGTLYTFLSEGTLVIASPHNRPAFGTWSREGEGLVMVEESLHYPVDILAATADTFAIRMHNPGEPVLITFVPAESLETLH
jgi:hypothetical protein